MAEKVIYKLQGHEKFPLREGWMTKGITAAKENNPHIFLEDRGPDILGVGSNMVKSIRYWMQACGMLKKEGNREELSSIAEIIYEKDKYFEDVFSLWILHSNLAKNRNYATVWYMFFNMIKADVFSKTDLQSKIKLELFNFVGHHVTESSMMNDIDVLLNMYSKGTVRNDDPEDKIICPLSVLGLIKKEDEIYYKIQPDIRKIDDALIFYELSCMFKNENSLSIEKIVSGENGLGALYHMTMVTANQYLDNLEALGFIRVDRTAGLDMVYPVMIKEPDEFIRDYYNK